MGKGKQFSAGRDFRAGEGTTGIPELSDTFGILDKTPLYRQIKIQYFYIEKTENGIYIYTPVC